MYSHAAFRRRFPAALCALVTSTTACDLSLFALETPRVGGSLAADTTPPTRGYVSDYVIVISVDGLRPDAIARFRARTLQQLMREGSYSLAAQTVLPSLTCRRTRRC